MKWCSKPGHQGYRDHGGYITGCNDCVNEKIMSDIPDIIEMHRKNDHTTKETLEKAANEWIAKCESNPKYPGGHYPLVIDTFIAGAEWERERAKVLVEALDAISLKQDQCIYNHNEEFMRGSNRAFNDCASYAKEAIAKYRGEN